MRHTTLCITILALSFFSSSCNKRTASLSSQDPVAAQDEKGNTIDAEGTLPTEEGIVAEGIAAPKKWPKCWLSYRLSVLTSFHIAGNRGNTWTDPTYTQEDGRQEFQGNSKNPTASGNCILNWFDQDYSKEPWVALFKKEFPRYNAVISCSAQSTPDCLCASTMPVESPDGFLTSEERCVRKSSDGKSYSLYGVHEIADNQTVPAAGRCDAAHKATSAIAKTNLGTDSFMQQTQDKLEIGGAGQTCRTDFEPFAPQPDEKDWYADKIRDWAITTCSDQSTGCRCYAIYNKSGYQDGARSGLFEHETCLLCADGTCQLAKR